MTRHFALFRYRSRFMNFVEPDDLTLKWLEDSKAKSADLWLQLWHIFCKTILKLFLTQTCCNGLLKRGSMFILSENVSGVSLFFFFFYQHSKATHVIVIRASLFFSLELVLTQQHSVSKVIVMFYACSLSLSLSSNFPVFSYMAVLVSETIAPLICSTSALVSKISSAAFFFLSLINNFNHVPGDGEITLRLAKSLIQINSNISLKGRSVSPVYF
jgi:hypothetical protein